MKKALALSMALAMSAAMLAGCGGSASDSTSASGAASSADSAASGTPTVSFMIPDFTGHVLSNEHSDEVIAKYEADLLKTDHRIELAEPPNTVLMAAVSQLSFRWVDVPWALM